MYHKVILVGNLGRDPEMRYLGSGSPVTNFSMATSEKWKDAEGNSQEKTEWHNIVAWRNLAEICGQYLKKGSKAYIEGKLQTRSWDDKNTGVKKYMTEIVADNLIMLDSRGQGGESAGEKNAGEKNTVTQEQSSPDSDLPF